MSVKRSIVAWCCNGPHRLPPTRVLLLGADPTRRRADVYEVDGSFAIWPYALRHERAAGSGIRFIAPIWGGISERPRASAAMLRSRPLQARPTLDHNSTVGL